MLGFVHPSGVFVNVEVVDGVVGLLYYVLGVW